MVIKIKLPYGWAFHLTLIAMYHLLFHLMLWGTISAKILRNSYRKKCTRNDWIFSTHTWTLSTSSTFLILNCLLYTALSWLIIFSQVTHISSWLCGEAMIRLRVCLLNSTLIETFLNKSPWKKTFCPLFMSRTQLAQGFRAIMRR